MRQQNASHAVYVDVVETDVGAGVKLLAAAGFSVRQIVATSAEALVEGARDATALLVGDSAITREVLLALPELRIVAACSVGIDHIDTEAARERGVWVSNVPDAATEEVAVHALAMALALIRHLPGWDRQVRSGGWDYRAEGALNRPSGLTLGLVGLGRIGRRVAEIGRPIFQKVVAADPGIADREWPQDVERTALDDVFARANVVSLHLPLSPETQGIVDGRRLGLMSRGSYIVNVSRGKLVDQQALLEALEEGRLAGAGLDVFPVEPPSPSDPLLRHPKVLLSPHVAFLSEEADRAYIVNQAGNVIAWYRDGVPLNPVVQGRRA